MLTKFYLQAQDDDTIFALHATTDISIQLPSQASQFPIQSGQDVSDNIVRKNNKGSLSVVVTDIYTTLDASQVKISYDYIEDLKDKLDSKILFTVFFSDNIDPLSNCVAENVTISKDTTLGGDSWNVNISFTQLRIAQQAQFAIIPAVDVENSVAERQEATQSKEQIPDEVDVCLYAVDVRKSRDGFLTGSGNIIASCNEIGSISSQSDRRAQLNVNIASLDLNSDEQTKVDDYRSSKNV